MKASIVIATYNRAEDLGRCLDSVLVQQNCDIEIIVVNDASTDSTQSLIEEKFFGRVDLITRESNSGSINNRNFGAKRAKGDVLFLIDDDTEIPGLNTVSEVLQEFENPQVGAVAIPYLQDGIVGHAHSGATDGLFVRASYVGCASAVRSSTFMSCGGYEEAKSVRV